jgi:hypothetical protein
LAETAELFELISEARIDARHGSVGDLDHGTFPAWNNGSVDGRLSQAFNHFG